MGLRSLWRKTKNVAGDAAVYGTAIPTGGLSLLAKKNNRDMVGNAWNDVTGKTAARDAARGQATAAGQATDLQRGAYEKNLELNKPWYDAGVSALSDLAGGVKSGAFEAPDEQFNEALPQEQYQAPSFNFDFKADPGYQFRLDQASKATERSAAARGGLFSGATLSDLASQSGQMASEEYGNAYNRARQGFESDRDQSYGAYRDKVGDSMQNRNFNYGVFSDKQSRKRDDLNNRFNRLSSLAGLGEAATSRQGSAATAFGQQAGDNLIGAANAKAAGRVGGYNAQRDFVMGLGNLGMKGLGMALGG